MGATFGTGFGSGGGEGTEDEAAGMADETGEFKVSDEAVARVVRPVVGRHAHTHGGRFGGWKLGGRGGEGDAGGDEGDCGLVYRTTGWEA